MVIILWTREESDKLIEIIKSRVVDFSTIVEGQGAGLMVTPVRRYGDDIASCNIQNTKNKVSDMFVNCSFYGFSYISHADTPERCSKAVMEAKSWLEEKKAGSSSKSDMGHELSAFGSVPLQHVSNSVAAICIYSKQLP